MESFTDNPTVGLKKATAQMIHFGTGSLGEAEDPWTFAEAEGARPERLEGLPRAGDCHHSQAGRWWVLRGGGT